MDQEQLDRVIIGALRNAIGDHGPITYALMPSASKRIIGQLGGFDFHQFPTDFRIARLEKDNARLRLRCHKYAEHMKTLYGDKNE